MNILKVARASFALLLFAALGARSDAATSDDVLLRFAPHAGAGVAPYDGVIVDAAGNVFGTTTYGGIGTCKTYGYDGCGVIFELEKPATNEGSWKQVVLYRYPGPARGFAANSLILGPRGHLYGTSEVGGVGDCSTHGAGCGTLFELTPPATVGAAWKFTTRYAFDGRRGGLPGGLLLGKDGNFYGTSAFPAGVGCGNVFELAPQSGGGFTYRTLYSFKGIARRQIIGDGCAPLGVQFGPRGELVVATVYGGRQQGGEGGGQFGAVVRLSPPARATGDWTEAVLHRFSIAESNPVSSVAVAADGTIFGTTYAEVYALSGDVTKPIDLFAFGGPGGDYPYGGVTLGPGGNLYGTAAGGGGPGSNGVVYRLSPTASGPWRETVLHTFAGVPDGSGPVAPVAFGPDGSLLGTTLYGGAPGCVYYATKSCGTVWRLAP